MLCCVVRDRLRRGPRFLGIERGQAPGPLSVQQPALSHAPSDAGVTASRRIHICVEREGYVYTYIYIYIYIDIYIHTHTHTHTYIHAYIDTYIYDTSVVYLKIPLSSISRYFTGGSKAASKRPRQEGAVQ